MKSFLKFFAVVSVILLGSAILAPIIYPHFDYKFERVFNRIFMIGTLVAVLCFVRIRRETWGSYGMLWKKHESLPYLFTSFISGVITLVLLAALKVAVGDGVWAPEDALALKVLSKMPVLFGTAFLIGTIEEFFFRGFIFSSFRNRFGWGLVVSVVMTSLFYSLVHFVSYKKPYIGAEPGFVDSLKLIGMPFLSITYFPSFWAAAVGLFVFGVVLNILVIRTKSLYPAIGLHAGCVFFVKMDGLFLDYMNKNPLLFSTKKMYDGIISWFFLLALAWVLTRLLRTKG